MRNHKKKKTKKKNERFSLWLCFAGVTQILELREIYEFLLKPNCNSNKKNFKTASVLPSSLSFLLILNFLPFLFSSCKRVYFNILQLRGGTVRKQKLLDTVNPRKKEPAFFQVSSPNLFLHKCMVISTNSSYGS